MSSKVEKMKKNIPELRFPGFEEEWEEKRLGDLCKVKTGNKDTKDKIDGGSYPFFVRSNTVERIGSYSYDGEAFLTSGDGVGVGKNFHYINGKFDYHQRVYALFNFEKQAFGRFLFLLFSRDFYGRVMRMSAKNSVDSVRMDMITKMNISLPGIMEQKKIADFLSLVDEWIQNLKAQKEKWEEYKKGIMQKIFSQEIRFKDEGGGDFPEWEEKRLGDVGKFLKGKGISKEDVVEGGDNKCIRYGELYTEYDEIVDDVVSRTNVSAGSSFLSKVGDLLVPSSGETAWDIATATAVLEDGVLLGSDMNVLRFEQVIDSRFLAYYLSYGVKRLLARLAQGNSVVHLYASNLRKMRLLIPFIGEQQKIVSYLSPVDEIIGCYEQKIIRAEEWKKGLIQKMFV